MTLVYIIGIVLIVATVLVIGLLPMFAVNLSLTDEAGQLEDVEQV